MDDLQIRALAINAACTRYAGLEDHEMGCIKAAEVIILTAKEFEKYLKGEKND